MTKRHIQNNVKRFTHDEIMKIARQSMKDNKKLLDKLGEMQMTECAICSRHLIDHDEKDLWICLKQALATCSMQEKLIEALKKTIKINL